MVVPINGKDPHLQNPIPTRRINMPPPRSGGNDRKSKGCALLLFFTLALPVLTAWLVTR